MRKQMAIVALALLPACGDGGSSAPTPVTTPPPPSRASVSIAQAGTGQVCLSPIRTLRIRIPMRVTETAGLGANFNFVRLSLQRGGREVERSEMTAVDLRNVNAGRLGANGTLAVTFSHDINAGADEWDTFLYQSNFTDDRGNSIDVQQQPPFNVVATLICSI